MPRSSMKLPRPVASSYGCSIRNSPSPKSMPSYGWPKTTPRATCGSGWETAMAKVSTSTFWQLERAQTALRMRQSQARFWRPVIGVVWLLCSAVYLWVGIGTAGRGYFVVWLNASFWGWLWPRHLVAFQGRWYAPQTLAHWLQQTV